MRLNKHAHHRKRYLGRTLEDRAQQWARASLPQKAIARWPHDGVGIDPGSLGA
jgi:hypothetical protein